MASFEFKHDRLEEYEQEQVEQLKNDLEFYHNLRTCTDEYIRAVIDTSLDTLANALRLYGAQYVFSSYNGGKDADVTFHLLRAAAAKHAYDRCQVKQPNFVFFEQDGEFKEVIQHINDVSKKFSVKLEKLSGGIVEGIKSLVAAASPRHIAFVMGTRSTDPHGQQGTFSPSSTWIPVDYMRVNPILDWKYGHVFHFLRYFSLPYCKLYDAGYTSLGSTSQCYPNPYLRRLSAHQGSNAPYFPAYMLHDYTKERAGRGTTAAVAAVAAEAATVTMAATTTTEVASPIVASMHVAGRAEHEHTDCFSAATAAAAVCEGGESPHNGGSISHAVQPAPKVGLLIMGQDNLVRFMQYIAECGVKFSEVTVLADEESARVVDVVRAMHRRHMVVLLLCQASVTRVRQIMIESIARAIEVPLLYDVATAIITAPESVDANNERAGGERKSIAEASTAKFDLIPGGSRYLCAAGQELLSCPGYVFLLDSTSPVGILGQQLSYLVERLSSQSVGGTVSEALLLSRSVSLSSSSSLSQSPATLSPSSSPLLFDEDLTALVSAVQKLHSNVTIQVDPMSQIVCLVSESVGHLHAALASILTRTSKYGLLRALSQTTPPLYTL